MSAENAPPTAAEPSVEYMGALIRRLRESAGMTLTDLSRVARVSQGRAESDRTWPRQSLPISPCSRSPRHLMCPSDDSSTRVGNLPTIVWSAPISRRQLQVTDRGLVYELLTPTMNGQLLVLKVRIPSGYSNESVPFNHHRAEECLFVLEGTCYFQIGEDGYTLDAGDSITYQGDQPHWFRVVGDAETVIIATMTPPVF